MARVQKIKGQSVNGRSNIIARLFKGGKQKPHPDAAKAAKGVMIAGDDLDYFRVEFDDNPSFNKEWALECFRKLYGDKPREFLNVQFRTDNAEVALSSINEQWVKSGKGIPICSQRCDGMYINYRWNGDSASRESVPCEYPKCKCAFTYRLTFWLPEFTQRSGILGEFMITGHSREDYERIQPNLDEIANADGEMLRRVGFTLYRKQVRLVQPDGKPSVKWIVHLNVMEAAAQRLALAAGEAALTALPAPQTPINNVVEIDETSADSAFSNSSTYVIAIERRQSGQNNRYVLDTESGHKVTIFTRDLFREAGHDVEGWKDIKGRQEIMPIAITETWDGQYWQLADVVPVQPPSLAEQIPF